MSREEEVQFEQDNLGNERKKLDAVRSQEGVKGDSADDSGIVAIQSADTGSDLLVLESPQHASELYVTQIQAFNSSSSGDTFRLLEVELDSGGNITNTTQRSVPFSVDPGDDRIIEYSGAAFGNSVGVRSDFAGEIATAVLSDHKEHEEESVEQTEV